MEEITILNNFLSFQVVEIKTETNIEELAKKWNVQISQILFINKVIKSGDKVIIKNLNRKVHIVRPLETLSDIAKKYNMSKEEIIRKNKISKLFIGQQLLL